MARRNGGECHEEIPGLHSLPTLEDTSIARAHDATRRGAPASLTSAIFAPSSTSRTASKRSVAAEVAGHNLSSDTEHVELPLGWLRFSFTLGTASSAGRHPD
jgi:hypothetical protein